MSCCCSAGVDFVLLVCSTAVTEKRLPVDCLWIAAKLPLSDYCTLCACLQAKEKDGLTAAQRKERDAKALQEKLAKKQATDGEQKAEKCGFTCNVLAASGLMGAHCATYMMQRDLVACRLSSGRVNLHL